MLYDFACERCKVKWELKLTISEHSAIKDKITCEVCGQKAFQVVAPLHFRLVGEGWFGRDGGCNASGIGYEVTQTELNKNLDKMNYAEDYANAMMAEDDKNLRAGVVI
jgi:hypothetical protein